MGQDQVKTSGPSDAPAPIAVQPEDWVVTRTRQATTLLNEAGIWNILLAGSDASGCLLTTDGGLLHMAPLGYRIIVPEDCAVSVEFPDTEETQGTRWAMLRSMQLAGHCYLSTGTEIINAINSSTE